MSFGRSLAWCAIFAVVFMVVGKAAFALPVGVCTSGGGDGLVYSACGVSGHVEASELVGTDLVFVCEGAPAAEGTGSCSVAGGSVYMHLLSSLTGAELVDVNGLWGTLTSAGWTGGGGGPGGDGGSEGVGILPELTPAQAGELFRAALPLLALAWVGWFLRRTIWRIGR